MRLRRFLLPPLGAAALALSPGSAAAAEVHDEVLVVVNRESPVSRAIGAYYRAARNVPAENVFEVAVPLRDPALGDRRDDWISRADYEKKIRDPIAAFLTERRLAGRIEVIVTTQGVPLIVHKANIPLDQLLRRETGAAVDAELALLFSGRDGSAGIVDSLNPYFGSERPFAAWREANPEAPLRYLVARLAGYATPLDPETGVPVDVKRSVDAARAPARPGIFVVDEDPAASVGRNAANWQMLRPAAALLEAQGRSVRREQTRGAVRDLEDVVGLASWGSNASGNPGAPYWGRIQGALYPGRFAPRAVAVPLVSTNARSFVNPTEYGQSLVADLLRLGAAGCAGHVTEPTLVAVPRAHLLLHHYARGVPAAEAYFRSVPYLGWMNVWIGDPLMRWDGPPPADRSDRDGDGTPDVRDNCLWIPNPSQRDSDGDGFGNRCDADVDGDGVVSTSWGTLLPEEVRGDVETIALAAQLGRYFAALDLDEDGDVDPLDAAIAHLSIFQAPGPRGPEAPRPGLTPPSPPAPPPAAAR